jgi:hypothetical protein
MNEHPTPPSPRDDQAEALRARFPGWRVWYVTRAVDRGAWWSAQPARYPLIAGDPDDLAAAIEADPCGGAAGGPDPVG